MRTVLRLSAITMLSSIAISAAAETVTADSRTVGQISVTSENPAGWKIDVSTEDAGNLRECITISISRSEAAVPPAMTVGFEIPLLDMYHVWHCHHSNERFPLKPEWGNNIDTQIARDLPLLSCFNDENTNRLTMACNDSYRYIKFACGVKEEGALYKFKMDLFTSPEAPISSYTVKLLLDRRPVFWSKAIQEASAWIMESSSLEPCKVPRTAYEPLYSSWYQFHQNVSAKEIEEECRIASQMGMKTIILDDGWQTEDNHRGYAFCGDWRISRNKFPDMRAHVDAIHKMGMKYMVWYSVPYVGIHSDAYSRFKGKYLSEKYSWGVLDPRFPEVREYLASTYETAMKEWGLDGFKLDFIDQFNISGGDPAIAENYAGRDIKSLSEAVDVLMKDIAKRLHAINDDVLIEFRQHYIGPAIRQYGNMFRCGDCPADFFSNRIRSTNLRLTSGNTAVHSDMLEWNPGESTEVAARQILSSIFATVQYSLMLRDLSPEHKKLIAHWISFTKEHQNTLLHSEFLPYDPQMCYPVIEARSAEEQICAVYEAGKKVNVGSAAPKSYLINATVSTEVITRFAAKPRSIRIFNTLGDETPSGMNCKKIHPGELSVLSIPKSGYAEIIW